PRFRDLERQHGSLIRGMLAAANQHPPASSTNGAKPKPTLFTSFKGGMAELVSALTSQLTGDCRLGVEVTGITRPQSLTSSQFELSLSDGSRLDTDAVVLAVPAFAAAALLQNIAPDAALELEKIRYVSTGTVSLAYRRADIQHPLNGFGIVIPRSEKRSI